MTDLANGDLVKVLEGPHAGQAATVIRVYEDLHYPYVLEFAKGYGSYKRFELRKVEA